MELLQIAIAQFITKCDGQLLQLATAFFITKCDTVYYKLRQELQRAMDLLPIVTGITKCDDYYKLRQYVTGLLQFERVFSFLSKVLSIIFWCYHIGCVVIVLPYSTSYCSSNHYIEWQS